MAFDLLSDVAKKITDGNILVDWKFFGILACLNIVAGALGAYLAGYARRRGESKAVKADFEEILQQLRRNTDASEQIKVAISHNDWATREWKTLRRIKLEELLASIYESSAWIERFRTERMYDENVAGPSPLPKLRLISILYFPELKTDLRKILVRLHEGHLCILQGHRHLLDATTHEEKMQVRIKCDAEFVQNHQKYVDELDLLESKLQVVLSKIMPEA